MDIIAGIYHVAILGTNLERSKVFYSDVLGLSTMQHIEAASPLSASFMSTPYADRPSGSLSVLPDRPEEELGQGAGSVGAVVFAVRPRSLPVWRRHLADHGVSITGRAWAFGEEYLCFSDPDGLDLALVEEPEGLAFPEFSPPFSRGGLYPLRLHAVELHPKGAQGVLHRLWGVLGLPLRAREGPLLRFTIGDPEPVGNIDMFSKPRTRPRPVARSCIQSIALEVSSQEALAVLAVSLSQGGFDVEMPRDDRSPLWVRLKSELGFDLALCLADQREIDLSELNCARSGPAAPPP